jgi:hypothetical protein
MTNSDLLALAMPIIAVVAVGLTAAGVVFQIKHQDRSRRKASSKGVRGRLSEVEGGLFRFEPDSRTAMASTLKKQAEKETAGN